MSESHNPKDNQVLLQSMLQRLKLQPGKGGQADHTPVHTSSAPTWGQDGGRRASNPENVNSSPVNGLEFGTNGFPSKEFGISATGSNVGLKGGEIQQPGHESEVDRSLFSFPSQKDNIDVDTGEGRVFGQTTQPGITLTATGQRFPAESLKDADSTSFERTHGERGSFGTSAVTRHIPSKKDAVTSMGHNQNQDQDFTPRVYVWSLKPTVSNADTRSQDVLHVGNGGFGALSQSKDMQIVPTNSSFRRKQRSSENKTRKWTQKIKERWKDRPGSFGKKGKEDGRRIEQGTEISPQNQLRTAENVIDTSNKEEERTLPPLNSTDPSNTPSTRTGDGTNTEYLSSTGDFEFGLGSFSLLEEIVTGQEWAKFLNPNQAAASAKQRPSELKIPPNHHGNGPSSLIMNQQGGVDSQWSFRRSEASPDLDFSMAQISPDAFQPVNMDVSEGKLNAVRIVHSEAGQTEPMEHGHTRRPPSFAGPADTLDNSALRSRVHTNRKRQHQPAHRGDERFHTEQISDGKEADRDGSISSRIQTSNHVMEETGESQHDNHVPLYSLNSPPTPLSPSAPFAPAPQGVLKHSISQDSQCSMETQTKRRRVENRRVRFSEEIFAIAPLELDPNATDSEDSGSEEDSVIERESEEEQEEIEVVAAPARRPALPAWIQALKRRNTGGKHRKGL